MQIKITDITPFMRKGWIFMDSDNIWYWSDSKPWTIAQDKKEKDKKWYVNTINLYTLEAFDIAPADDWTKSLIKVGKNENTCTNKY